ncbi:MAG: hypothetical protein OEM94_10025 [Acidimicrobiia bacterium]|nr:hypothetical protein [Acidimicrobiia bacterium]
MTDQTTTGVSRQALTATESPISVQSLLATMLLAAMLAGNVVSLQAFVIVVTGVAALWVWDLTDFAAKGSTPMNPYPLLVAVAASAWGSYRWGFDGFAVATVVTTAATLLWAVFVPAERGLERLAATSLGALVAALAVGPLVLLRMRSDVEVNAFLLIMGAALVASLIALSVQDRLPLLDPSIAALAAAALAGLIAGSVSGLSLSVTFVAAVSAAGGLVAGRTAGSILRSGRIMLLERAPGALTLVDGVLVAAGIYWLAIVVLSA